jgi:cell division ATPase FtsA
MASDITAALRRNWRFPLRAAEQIKREFKLDTAEIRPGLRSGSDSEVRGENGMRYRVSHDIVKDIIENTMND